MEGRALLSTWFQKGQGKFPNSVPNRGEQALDDDQDDDGAWRVEENYDEEGGFGQRLLEWGSVGLNLQGHRTLLCEWPVPSRKFCSEKWFCRRP